VVVVAVESSAGDAGIRAVRQLESLPLSRGRVALIQSRPLIAEPAPASSAWKSCESLQELEQRYPDATLLVLRESYDSHRNSSTGSGSTIGGHGVSAAAVLETLRRVEAPDREAWKAIASDADARIVVTTSSKDPRRLQRPAVRQRQHRAAIGALLRHLSMIEQDVTHRVFAGRTEERIRVAVYDDRGSVSSSGHGPAWLQSQLSADPRLSVELIGQPEVIGGVLEQADVIVFGGGSSSSQAGGLQASGRDAVRDFVHRGGGYVGICAGAFLASQPRGRYDYLGLLPVRSRSNSGSFITPLKWASSPIGPERQEDCKYSNGPLLYPVESDSDVEVWSRFESGAEDDDLADKPAVIAGAYGRGNVVIFSPHCERFPSQTTLFPDAVRWAAGD
jgi:glutamine amidotransferase-like uncharacterized protein